MATINGTAAANTLYGTSAGDLIQGFGGDDDIRDYSGGNDTYVFNAGDGNDLIGDYNASAAVENDILLLGAGLTRASIRFDAVADGGLKISFAGNATDSVVIQYHLYGDGRWDFRTVQFNDGTQLDISYASAAYTLNRTGTAGNDSIYSQHAGTDIIHGGEGHDSLGGGGGQDEVWGEGGDDVIWGDAGNDTLLGGSGADTLYAGAGNDRLEGGAGADELWGQDGNDTYLVDHQGDQIYDSVGANTVVVAATLDNYKAPAGFTVTFESASTLRLAYFIDALTSGATWSTMGTGATVDFSFVETSDLAGFQPYSASQKTQIRNILAEYAAVSGLVFVETADTTDTRIRFFKDGGPGSIGAAGYAGYPTDGDVHIDPDYAANYHVLFHEIGHALGLKHPGDYGGDPDGPFLPAGEDTTDNTQMSYNGYGEGGNYFRLFDLAAIQYLYGVNTTARTGNSTYTQADRYVWDGGGVDTISLTTATAAASVDLRDGAWCWVGAKAASILADGQFFIGCGSVIENVVGTAWGDVIGGNEAANLLDGRAGADTLAGGSGNDTYILSSGDVVTETADAGIDEIQAGFSYTLGNHIENLRQTGTAGATGVGNSLANRITGNSGNNLLDGKAGADTLIGGLGNDTYVVSSGDVVTENAAEGVDEVRVGFSYTLGANLDNLLLTGTANAGGAGNADANRLTGNGGNNLLDGKAGADTLSGGAGNDTYVLSSGDVVTENAAEGTDEVRVGFSYTLGANLENLLLTGTASASGTGNASANLLTGNAGANRLSGGQGADTLSGGAGNDSYIMARGDGADLVTDSDATAGNTDRLWFNDATVAHDQLWFRQLGNDLEVSIIGTADRALVRNWYVSVSNRIEEIRSGNGKTLLSGEVAALVDAMAVLTAPAPGQTLLSGEQHALLDSVIAANWS